MRARAVPCSRSSAIARARTSVLETISGSRTPNGVGSLYSGHVVSCHASSSSQARASSLTEISSPHAANSISPGPCTSAGAGPGGAWAWSRTASASGSERLASNSASSPSNAGRAGLAVSARSTPTARRRAQHGAQLVREAVGPQEVAVAGAARRTVAGRSRRPAAGVGARARSRNRFTSSTRNSLSHSAMQSSCWSARSARFSERVGAVGRWVAGSVASQTAASNGTSRRSRSDATLKTSPTLRAARARSMSSVRAWATVGTSTAIAQTSVPRPAHVPTPRLRGSAPRGSRRFGLAAAGLSQHAAATMRVLVTTTIKAAANHTKEVPA